MNRLVILKPLISEKSMGLAKENLYTFLVDRNADKNKISKAVSDKFNVTVLSVKTINIRGKTKLQRTRKGYFQSSPFKKAVVHLKTGQRIALFESPSAPEDVEVRTAEGEPVVKTKEKKSLLRGTKVKIESTKKEPEEPKELKSKKKTVKKKGE